VLAGARERFIIDAFPAPNGSDGILGIENEAPSSVFGGNLRPVEASVLLNATVETIQELPKGGERLGWKKWDETAQQQTLKDPSMG